ncbi:LacI family transcriptional regulator [Xanthomonas phaseoli pv. phaseoli]|uniref:LacI family transcriptional regulator n=4 Tax=Xanthomonas TaxID=338 RepID=A0AA44YYR6_XANCM|nr:MULTISPECIES: LacI family DNA-binding transcriptional regulator [Xanthomonas]OOW61083.1 LacI family transcriptional regulator [Xanthomonas campestris pv. thespesiae]OOW77743.1 LacI family transcriptional regulator [Xanthomonas campestris pv. leeana]OOW85262.1 LacI family transcriptional regulator [Xanthomonas campestris pv. vitiswoodrowii]OOW88702.1 LacI family transcriptional regulator [Xanthomonas campestris pv. vitistrifoliae]AOL21326.1 LacI family transcriptional regulator [Xanthomonas 
MSRPRSEGGSVTIKDVAREAQVSVATVSRTMNGHQHVAESVRERVLQVARALNYIPHHAARSLSSRRTHTIGVVLPDLHGEFFSELIRGIDQVARDQGYHLLVSSSHGDPQAQRRALERLPGRVDGVVVMSPSLGDSGVHEDALPGGLPAVLLNCAGSASQRPVLNVDNYGGARVMTRHLRDSGHRRIAFIAGPDDNFDAHERMRGYRDELALDPAVQPWVLPGNFDEESGYRAGQALARDTRPDAVFAANDMMALGCLFALGHAGLKVPQDIALAGFDDVPMARYVLPALTTMRVDIAGLGARALQLLLGQQLVDAPAPPAEAAPPAFSQMVPELIVRASSAARGTAGH